MKRYLFTYNKKRQYILLIGDIIMIITAICIGYVFRDYATYKIFYLPRFLSRLSPWLLIVINIHLFSLYLLSLYDLNQFVNRFRACIKLLLSILLSGLLISGIFFFFPKYVFGRKILLIHLGIVSVILILWRLIFAEILMKGIKPKQLVVIGDGQILSSFIEDLSHIPNSGYILKGVCSQNNKNSSNCILSAGFSNYNNISDLLKRCDFDALSFDSTNCYFSDQEIRYILEAKINGKAIYDLSTLYQNLTGKVPLTYIDGRWLLNANGIQGEVNLPYIRTKRVFDILFSSILIVIATPLLAIITLAIKLDRKGTVFFVQERLGINKQPFKCLKFRTMVANAEQNTGPVWSKENDPRITLVGNFLRKTRMDELPQLWNVLKGDMGLIGPRPIREHFANILAKQISFYNLRFNVKPGLTGWAQVNHDYAGSEEGQLEKFQYELFYIQNMSFFLDVLTVIKTVRKVFRGEGT